MENTYFHIPREKIGYLPILRKFRTEIPLATKKHYKNLEFQVEVNLPNEIKEQLPIFGLPNFLSSDFYALNSGGRGILLSDRETHLRFKGNDINGSITLTVGRSEKNHISDIRLAAEEISQFDFNTAALNSGKIYQLPSYQGKSFSFFTKESIEKEKNASKIIGDAFEEKGFLRPYTFKGCITYPSIQWNGKPCSTIVFSLPSLESDLRFEELFRFGFLHLKFASPEKLRDIKDDFGDFLKKLTTWHGFVTAVMAENYLVPAPDSHQNQNYVLCHINETEIGSSRVDHTSTIIDKDNSYKYSNRMKEELAFFATLEIVLLHALELAKQKYKLDENRYTGYFDRAYKWYEPIKPLEVPEMDSYYKELYDAFQQGFEKRDTIPIPEKELISVVEKLSEVKIDEEKQRRINQYRDNILKGC